MNKMTAVCVTLLIIIATAILAYATVGATIQLPRTGQTSCYDASGTAIACSGTGQDGALQKGVAWPSPRFSDNANGTVTDNLTGLIWLKNANCTDAVAGIGSPSGLNWTEALTWSNNLASGKCGLSDGSTAGQWRLPNINELESLLDISISSPWALPTGHPFTGVKLDEYWSSTSNSSDRYFAWSVGMYHGDVDYRTKSMALYVWPVRGVD